MTAMQCDVAWPGEAGARDQLSIELLRHHLTTETIGRHIYLFGGVDSTNAVLRRLAEAGADEGTVVLAEEQTAGRGRAGVSWFSPPGVNFYGSVLLRPALAPHEVPVFAFTGSLALSDAVAVAGALAAIKWPNDVLIGGRKVAGSRVEYATLGARVSWVVLGVGANLNVTRAALREALGADAEAAVALHEAAGHEIDRNVFAATFLNCLEKWRAVYREQGPDAVLAAWRDRDALRGRRVEIRSETDRYQARVRRIDRDGYLVVEDDGGRERRVLTGAIRLLA